jgi:integrase
MKGITLKTLRYDFVARMLEKHDWPHVLSISGYTVTTSRRYSLSTKKGKGTPQERTDESLEEKVQAVLKREGDSLEGLVLQLSLQGLTYAEIIALTWEQVDIEARCVRLPNRTIPLQQPLCDALSAYGEEREGEHVFLTPRAKKLWREERLSVQMRNFLVRNGLEGSTVAQLKLALKDSSEKALLLEYARIKGINSIEASKLLGIVRSRTTQLINEMINEGKLVRLGSKAYPADTAIHPDNREEGIITYLKEHGPATHMEIVDLLHAGKRATLDLLTAMVKAGKLRKAGKGTYAICEDK